MYFKLILLWLEIDKLGLSTRDFFRSSFVEVGGMNDGGPDFTRLIVRITLAKEALILSVTFFNILKNRVTGRRRVAEGESK